MILDASALLAFLHDEPGADRVGKALDGGVVCTVNWSEVLQKSLRAGVDVAGMGQDFADIGLRF
ncbi:PIN domain-containing protein, partial [Klebsiella variicola]|uniref:PIN domain-containing protein n=1 Tax=Klebsiella variicola TaxID=244366 RepID=UPI0027319789